MSKLRRRTILFGSLFAGGTLGLNLLAYQHAHAMMHFTSGNTRTAQAEALTTGQKIKTLICGVQIPRPKTSLSSTSLGADCQCLTLPSTNGLKLGAWYCPAGPSSSLVILFHGYTSEKSGTLKEAKVFQSLGYSVLLVDFRGSGESSESYTTIGYDEGEDVATAVRYAREHLPHPKVILYGQSMGAAAVLRAVHNCNIQPDAIIVEAVFDKMLNTVRHRFEAMGVPAFPSAQLLVFWGGYQAHFNGFEHNPSDYAVSVRCPILFLHGTADPRAQLQEARRVYDAVPGPKRFEEFSGAVHEGTVVRFREQWTRAVAQFLSEK